MSANVDAGAEPGGVRLTSERVATPASAFRRTSRRGCSSRSVRSTASTTRQFGGTRPRPGDQQAARRDDGRDDLGRERSRHAARRFISPSSSRPGRRREAGLAHGVRPRCAASVCSSSTTTRTQRRSCSRGSRGCGAWTLIEADSMSRGRRPPWRGDARRCDLLIVDRELLGTVEARGCRPPAGAARRWRRRRAAAVGRTSSRAATPTALGASGIVAKPIRPARLLRRRSEHALGSAVAAAASIAPVAQADHSPLAERLPLRMLARRRQRRSTSRSPSLCSSASATP